MLHNKSPFTRKEADRRRAYEFARPNDLSIELCIELDSRHHRAKSQRDCINGANKARLTCSPRLHVCNLRNPEAHNQRRAQRSHEANASNQRDAQKICKLLSQGHTIATVCDAVGIGERTYYDCRERSPQFAQATNVRGWKLGRARAYLSPVRLFHLVQVEPSSTVSLCFRRTDAADKR
jgi:hypothetical protein